MLNRRGHPAAGGPIRRDAILEAAFAAFRRDGYAHSTLRGIAAVAECDVALIGYYFGSKHGLFEAVMQLTLGPPQVLAAMLPGDPATVGQRLVVGLMTAWEDQEAGARLADLVRHAAGDATLRAALAGYLERELVAPLVEYFGGIHATERAVVTVSALSGLLFSRYVIELPSMKKFTATEYASLLAPVVNAAASAPIRRSRTREGTGQPGS